MKIERHDGSLTLAEKIAFRQSDDWKRFRQSKYDEQGGKDFITGEDLLPFYNVHHLCLKSNEYTDLSDPSRYVALNPDTHNQVHKLFYGGCWHNQVTDGRMLYVLTRMAALNDTIEVNLYRNAYTYTLIDSTNKSQNAQYAMELGIPVNGYGMLQWHKYYIPANVPQETLAWLRYMVGLNGEDKALLLMELRHLNLYSSYRNFRNNPKANAYVQQQCLTELHTTTNWLRDYAMHAYNPIRSRANPPSDVYAPEEKMK